MNQAVSKVTKHEIIYVSVGFVLSMIHWGICMVFFAALLFFLKQGVVGCVKSLLLMTTRGILSSSISSKLSGAAQIEKWILIFVFTFYIFYYVKDLKKSAFLSTAQVLIVLFMVYNIITALITSSYPTVSLFKSISYALPFCAVLTAVNVSVSEFDWIQYCFWLLTPVMIASAITIPFSRFRIVNDSFQGIINHPNLFGIVGALYIVVSLYNMINNPERTHWFVFLMIALTFVMIYLCESRTGMFSAIIMLIVYFVSISSSNKVKMLAVVLGLLCVIGLFFVVKPSSYNNFSSNINQFVFKRDSENILDSREKQFMEADQKYEANKALGSGFAVPYTKEEQDFSFSLDITYESGNLPRAVLGDCGIIGSVIFWGYMLYMLAHTKTRKWVLFFFPIIVSFGEMAFFSTNNIAIFYYLFYGICLSQDDSEAKIDAS